MEGTLRAPAAGARSAAIPAHCPPPATRAASRRASVVTRWAPADCPKSTTRETSTQAGTDGRSAGCELSRSSRSNYEPSAGADLEWAPRNACEAIGCPCSWVTSWRRARASECV